MKVSELKSVIKVRLENLKCMLEVLEKGKVDGTFELNNSDYYARINELEKLLEKINDSKRKNKTKRTGESGVSDHSLGSDTEESNPEISPDLKKL
jgi:hypothetical protein